MMSKMARIIISSIFLVSCQSTILIPATCGSLVSDVPYERVNTDIVLSTPGNQRNYTVQDDLVFYADNYSEDVLETVPDKDLKVYLWNGSEWIQTKNKLDYLLKVSKFGAKSPDDPGQHIYDVFYDTSLIQGSTRVCVILRAVKDPENTHVAIASYIEIEIHP